MLTAKATMTRTSFATTVAMTSAQNGPLPPVSCSTAIAEAGERATMSVAQSDEKAASCGSVKFCKEERSGARASVVGNTSNHVVALMAATSSST